jgi:hypothetical protein
MRISITGLAMLFCAAAMTTEILRPLEHPDDWEAVGGSATSFRILEETLQIQQGQAEPSAILTREDYENFDLNFEFRCHEWEESGLLIHAPWNGSWRAGLIIALGDHAGDEPDVFRSGAIFRHVAPKVMAVKPHGEWNVCEVHMDWPQLRVVLNGQVVQDLDLSSHPRLGHTLRRGRLGFLNSYGWGMEVRNMTVTPLPDTAGAVTMLDGETLAGWNPVRNKRAWWTVADGVLRGEGGNGYLQYETPCKDFALDLYFRASSSANGGVFFRWKGDDSDRGHEIQILDLPDVGMVSGSIYGLVRGRDDLFKPGEWNLMQIFVKGTHAITYINGHQSAETDQLDKVDPGHITLQMHRDGSTIEWRDLVLMTADGRDAG